MGTSSSDFGSLNRNDVYIKGGGDGTLWGKNLKYRSIGDHPVFQCLWVHYFTGRSVSRKRIKRGKRNKMQGICLVFVPEKRNPLITK